MKSENRDNMRGGSGTINIVHLAEKEQLQHGRLLAEVTIPAGGSIGRHEHKDETEYYIILEGEGFVDEGGGEMSVSAGDVVVTGNGAVHSIRNPGDSPIRMIALIITGTG